MKKFDFERLKRIRLQKADLTKITDRMLLINLYFTQLLTLLAALGIMWLQKRNPLGVLALPDSYIPWVWGLVFACVVFAADALISRWVPEEFSDDGGINEKLFGRRPVWHIALISLIVAVCEEMLFRGAIQYMIGPYWTSIVFATLHVRYLRHWLMTGLTFSISYGLGWIAVQTGSLWTPIAAHFIIDLVMGLTIRFRGSTDRDEA
ncbi:CPBP family intramembrane glutamic endopeptidase [Paenibacillus thermotolerans]|uniref:CPBP family intramembrane glutamic endopeptidase n=1 Tax=Paenibacillus thermotolerans TaxID=3027807 RepID=UPI0023687F93|nr:MULTISPECIES: CPBP family intramembrane glutamic endopeptidase [unclassified Paenibacillus]